MMTTVKLHYVVILTGEDTIEVPDGAHNPETEAIRLAKENKPFLRGAHFEVVEVTTESDEASV